MDRVEHFPAVLCFGFQLTFIARVISGSACSAYDCEFVTAQNIHLVALLSVLRYYFETRQVYRLVHVYQIKHNCAIDYQGCRQ